MSDVRKARVAETMRAALSEMLARDVKDPRVQGTGFVSVTHVDLNRDLSVANVYVSVFGQDPEKTLAGLATAAGFLRGPLGRRLRLQRPPELRFFHDDSATMNRKIEEIVREDAERRDAVSEPTSDATKK